MFNDVTDVRAAEKKIAHCALHDELTGLANRANFVGRLNNAVHLARAEGRSHALCFIDLDRFMAVNDRGGHAAGDAVLVEVAAIISSCCMGNQIPARLGGDEFALLLPDCTAADAEVAARRIIGAIGSMGFRWQGELFRIGASIGTAVITADSVDLGEILRQADKACYAAKETGRNRVCVYNGSRRAHVRAFASDLQGHGSRRMHMH